MTLPLNLIIERQIERIIKRHLRKVAVEALPVSSDIQSQRISDNMAIENMERLYTPALMSMFNRRLIAGGEPVKFETNRIYIGTCSAIFREDEVTIVPATSIDIPAYADDRWVWVYLQEDKTYIANKYAPMIGANKERIPICKVWKEKGSTDFDFNLVRDIRRVGVGSANLNHVLRQSFLNLFLGTPATIVEGINVISHGGMSVKIGAVGDKILYARLNPVPDKILEIPLPPSGVSSIDYYVIIRAKVDVRDPDDLTFDFLTKNIIEPLSIFEIPLAIIRGVTHSTTSITSAMIETYGIQKKTNDFYTETLEFKEKGVLVPSVSAAPSYVELPHVVTYLGKIIKIVVYLGRTVFVSGQTVTLNVLLNETTIKTITFTESGTNLIKLETISQLVYPKDIIKIEIVNAPTLSGTEAKDLSIKVIYAKKF